MLVVMDQFTRRLIGFGVHHGAVDAPGLCCMFNAAMYGQGAPRYLSTDHDPLFEAHRWTASLRVLEVDEIKTVLDVPQSHASLEGHTPLGFAGGRAVARADLDRVRWVSHCRGMVQLPVAA